jgi:hypothetical protein
MKIGVQAIVDTAPCSLYLAKLTQSSFISFTERRVILHGTAFPF